MIWYINRLADQRGCLERYASYITDYNLNRENISDSNRSNSSERTKCQTDKLKLVSKFGGMSLGVL